MYLIDKISLKYKLIRNKRVTHYFLLIVPLNNFPQIIGVCVKFTKREVCRSMYFAFTDYLAFEPFVAIWNRLQRVITLLISQW